MVGNPLRLAVGDGRGVAVGALVWVGVAGGRLVGAWVGRGVAVAGLAALGVAVDTLVGAAASGVAFVADGLAAELAEVAAFLVGVLVGAGVCNTIARVTWGVLIPPGWPAGLLPMPVHQVIAANNKVNKIPPIDACLARLVAGLGFVWLCLLIDAFDRFGWSNNRDSTGKAADVASSIHAETRIYSCASIENGLPSGSEPSQTQIPGAAERTSPKATPRAVSVARAA